MKPVCISCERFMRPVHNGRYFLEGIPVRNGALSGKAEPESWKPYKLWSGDAWACPDCGAQIIIGTGRAPLSEHYLPSFDEKCQHYASINRGKPLVLIKDC